MGESRIMKSFLTTARLLLTDLASSFIFIILYSLTKNVVLSAGVGMALGLCQIAVQLGRHRPIDAMEWLSVFLVLASGTATVLTDDPRFVLFKPSAIYAIVGIVMLKPGWMNRYLPEIARTVAGDVATRVGFVWSGLMFFTSLLNIMLAWRLDLASWALAMGVFALVSKLLLFVAGFLAIRLTVRRRIRALAPEDRDALLQATGWQQGKH